MPIHGLDPALLAAPKPPHFDIERVIRPNIQALHPYRCARDDYQSGILLDANENALGHAIPRSGGTEIDDMLDVDLHRYPDPAQVEIKARLAEMRLGARDKHGHVFLGVGSDEVIDLLMRVCCVPGKDRILTTPPTYGMYGVCAQVNDLEVTKVPLRVEGGAFQLHVDRIKDACSSDPSIKLIWLCSPGNPTGTPIPLRDIKEILEFPGFNGFVVIDEAYIDFAAEGSSAAKLATEYSNVCILQTLSKGFGLAAIRLGAAIAHPALIQVLTNTKAPYNISTPSAMLALQALSPKGLEGMRANVKTLTTSREALLREFATPAFTQLGVGASLGGNSANFILLPILNRQTGEPDSQRAARIYKSLAEERGVVVRYRGNELGCAGCLRITVGTAEENEVMLKRFREALENM
ncbi:histidinol-phosphate aminotransferase [Auricularia subglabra TFB-10046 SS5]|uniref:histidinol-phosphate transaminase n=1 Tax=Auricularia subglabra (strain TFB-10046 / SS5) TaxID=717982 RepID=J0D948_AURST|nr:histidinol-phosphate aminotransferase [Auricularia subglabra TFB-10046 SS5]